MKNLKRVEFGKIFKLAGQGMNEFSAEDAWKNALENSDTALKKDDLSILEGFR